MVSTRVRLDALAISVLIRLQCFGTMVGHLEKKNSYQALTRGCTNHFRNISATHGNRLARKFTTGCYLFFNSTFQ